MLLPGVPHECRHLAEHELLPWLRAKSDETIVSHDLHVFGLTEPQVQEKLADLMDNAVNPSLAPYAKTGEVMLRLTAKGESEADCEERMAPLFWDVRARLGDWLYAVDTPGLEGRVLQLLKERGLTFSAAESCTGGLIAKRITDLSGASAVFRGGVVSYTNAVKAGVLGVPEELLAQYTAVSGARRPRDGRGRARADGERPCRVRHGRGRAGAGRRRPPRGAGLRRPDRRRAYLGAPSGARHRTRAHPRHGRAPRV